MLLRPPFTLALCLALASVPGGGGEVSPPIRKGLETIRSEEAMKHVRFLASPELEGRDTGQRGCEAAAEYLASEYARYGLAPLGDAKTDNAKDGERSFLQHYPITRTSTDPSSGLRVSMTDGTARELMLGKDLAPLTAFAVRDGSDEMRIVDGGTIAISKAEPDSRPQGAQRNATPIPVAMPPDCEGACVLFHVTGLESRDRYRLFAGASQAMRESKASALLFGPGPEQSMDVWEQAFDSSAAGVRQSRVEYGASEAPASNAASRPGGRRGGFNASPTTALMLANAKTAEGLAGSKGTLTLARKREVTSAANVVALLRGSDPELSKEYVICSAHYDHVGFQGGALHPGADDNASGTAALLEIAQAFTSTDPPKRSVIFLSVSGEEHGLWGSSYFASAPPVPLASIVGDLNTDMVGRTLLNGEQKPGFMLMTPSRGHRSFNTLAARALEIGPEYGFPDMGSGDVYWNRSDHYNFAKNGIPVMFLCNGEHEDYHGAGDTPDKIDGNKIERSARLTFQLGYEVAMAAERPKVLGPASKPASQPR